MKATPLLVAWHNDNAPIYSAHFESHGKGRLATAGGDNNVRLWKIEATGEDRKVTYLSTLAKHTQAVNVVRWSPRGETLASAGDDGNVLLWVLAENQTHQSHFGDDGLEDKETWRVKHMCRSFGSEIYDLAWSPDGVFFITGSMDNVARIYNAQTGQTVRQIAEHNHYVQGVAWDPLNEFVATQSSDRSVHIYTLKTKDGHFSLAQHGKTSKMDLPARRISSNSPAPPDFTGRTQSIAESVNSQAVGSPVPSAPGTPTSLALPMNPPATSHSRRSSFGSSPSIRRSVSPAPSLPLPAVMPSVSPNFHAGLGVRNANIYANETLTSFFRRLTFAPDGSLLFTPAGQYKTSQPTADRLKNSDEIINTVYIYTRAGLNKPPVAYLPGHKKPSIAVKCSPVYYTLRQAAAPTKQITVDTSSAEEEIPALPEPAHPAKPTTGNSSMDPPPLTSAPSPSQSITASSPKPSESESTPSASALPPGPPVAFGLPYRIVYAVATQDAVYLYDTQQQKPLCIVSNLHFATFTDLTWSSDGLTLLITSSDGFCSCLSFTAGELGQVYHGPIHSRQHPAVINTAVSSAQSTPTPTPTAASVPLAKQSSSGGFVPSPSPFVQARPSSPARSMSTSSVATQSSFAPIPEQGGVMMNNATPSMGSVPSVAAAHSSVSAMPLWTPPQTPMTGAGGTHSAASSVSGIAGYGPKKDSEAKRESESERDEPKDRRKRDAESEPEKGEGHPHAQKKRRIAPTPVSDSEGPAPSAASATSSQQQPD